MSHYNWKSPYGDLSDEVAHKLTIRVDETDHRLLKSVTITHGTITLILQTFYHDLAEYVRTNNLSYLDSDAFLDYVRKRADSRFAGDTASRDGRESAAGIHDDPPSRTNKSSGLQKTTGSRPRSRTKKD